jgi:hypothetical protein
MHAFTMDHEELLIISDAVPLLHHARSAIERQDYVGHPTNCGAHLQSDDQHQKAVVAVLVIHHLWSARE